MAYKMQTESLIANLAAWHGESPACYGLEFPHKLAQWIRDYFKESRIAVSLDYDYSKRAYNDSEIDAFRNALTDILLAFEPSPSVDSGAAMVAIWPDQKARETGKVKRMKGKPGKMFKRIFPDLPEIEIAAMVDSYREVFIGPDFRLFQSIKPEAFKKAYSGEQAPMVNPSTSQFRKNLAYSCMRLEFGSLPHHPSEAYASGDFAIHWSETPSGLIASRVVVCIAKNGVTISPPRHGPIYGVSEGAINLLESALSEIGSEQANYGAWSGATLQSLEYRGGYIAPYLDICPQSSEDSGHCLTITRGGNINHSDYSGVLNAESRYTCSDCSRSLDDDEGSSDDDGNLFCEVCYSERYSWCESCEETCNREELGAVHYISRGSYRESESYWCESCQNLHAVEIESGDLWKQEDTYTCANGEIISSTEYESGCWFTSDWDGEIYSCDKKANLESGECVSTSEIECDSDWKLRGDIWCKVQMDFEPLVDLPELAPLPPSLCGLRLPPSCYAFPCPPLAMQNA